MHENSRAFPFDVQEGTLPPPVETVLTRSAAELPAVLLVAGEASRRTRWAARAAAAVAEGLAHARRRVVIFDLDLESPALHEILGVPNEEGVADIFLYGASLRRVARVAPGGGFHVVPAGAPVPDVEEIFGHSRWARILAGFRDAGAVLVACAPVEAPGISALVARIPVVIGLAEPDEAESLKDRLPPGCELLGTLTRHDARPSIDSDALLDSLVKDGEGEAAASQRAAAPVADAGSERLLGARERRRAAAAAMAPKEPAFPVSDEETLEEPGFVSRTGRPRRRASPAIWVALALLVLLAGIVIAQQLRQGGPAPDEPAPAQADPAEPQPLAAEEPTAPAAEPRTLDEPLEYSVAVEAHQSFRLAEDRVATLSTAEPDLLFYLAPIAVDGVIFYRVLAGPAADRDSAIRIMERLVEARHKTQMQDWDVRPTAWAYEIGEYPDRGVAEAMQLELGEDGIPTYVVEVPFTEGPSRFRLYAGAYSGRAEAEIMERILEEAGIRAEFRRRAGRPAS